MKPSHIRSLLLVLLLLFAAAASFGPLSPTATVTAVTLATPFAVGDKADHTDDCVECKDGSEEWPYCDAGEHDAFDTHWDEETWRRNAELISVSPTVVIGSANTATDYSSSSVQKILTSEVT